MTSPESGRHLRICSLCGAYDDLPHHITWHPHEPNVPDDDFLAGLEDKAVSPRAVAELMHPDFTNAHHACCAANGCGECLALLAVTGSLEGHELTAAITSGAVNHLSTSGE